MTWYNFANLFIQGHGSLHDIYDTVKVKAEKKNWDSVDLVIIGGDFQASIISHSASTDF
jgi:lariat debranching enzyme